MERYIGTAIEMASRREVINCFKSLLRTSQQVFHNDSTAKEKARQEIRHKFDENRRVTDPAEIARMVKLGHDVRAELATVARAELNPTTGHYELRLEARHLTNNAPWPSLTSKHGQLKVNSRSSEGYCGGAGGKT